MSGQLNKNDRMTWHMHTEQKITKEACIREMII